MKEQRKQSVYLLLAIMFILICSMNFSLAQTDQLGIFKQGDCVDLLQTCADCSYNVITSVTYPNSSQALGQHTMTKINTQYNYTFCKTSLLGTYLVNGYGDLGGTDTIWNYNFEVTKNGQDSTNSDFMPIIIAIGGVIIILLVLSYFLSENHGILAALFAGIGFYMLIPLLNVANNALENNYNDLGISGMINAITTILTWLDYALIIYIIVYTFIITISGYNQDKHAKMEGLR